MTGDSARRRLGWGALVGSIVVFILGAHFVGLFIVPGDGTGSSFASIRSALGSEVVPDLLGALFAIGLVVVVLVGRRHIDRTGAAAPEGW